VLLARHGRSAANEARVVAGRHDVALSGAGIEQAQQLAASLSALQLAAVCSSALRRSRETASTIAAPHRLPVTAVEAFNEMHFGTLEGCRRDIEPTRSLYEAWRREPQQTSPFGGESMDAVTERVEPALRQLIEAHLGQTVLIVGHQVTNRVLLGLLVGSGTQAFERLRVRTRNVYEITLSCAMAPRSVRTHTIRAATMTTTEGIHD
jgi:broad specificity phosphatase PhoE